LAGLIFEFEMDGIFLSATLLELLPAEISKSNQ